MLIGIIVIYLSSGSTDIIEVAGYIFPLTVQKWLWLSFFIAFAVKIPMWPLHTWLPDAHVEAPTAGSIILAGLLIKMGGYGLLRISLSLLPDASKYYANFVFIISIVAVIYSSLVALAQRDMKKLVAYSSIAHMGFTTVGIFTFSNDGIQGAILQMISHGLISAGLFICIGLLYERTNTRNIHDYNGGIVEKMPAYATVLLIFILSAIGLPGTSGFISEFMIIFAVFDVNVLLALCLCLGIVIGTIYFLWLYKRVVWGEIRNTQFDNITDLTNREKITLIILLILTIMIGIYPSIILNISSNAVAKIVHLYPR